MCNLTPSGVARRADESPFWGSGCPDQDTLIEYLDDELAVTSGRAIEAHLKGCEACRIACDLLEDDGW